MATLTIPDKLYERLKAVAASRQRSVEEFMIEMIENVDPDCENGYVPLTRDEEMRLLREAMTGRIWAKEDVDAFFDSLDLPEMSDEEADRIVNAIPPLNPSMSQTLIRMREEERY